MTLTQIGTGGVKNDAITKTKIPANQIEASELADNAVDTAAIADQAVALNKLPHGDGSSDGKFLRANNGADPSFESLPVTQSLQYSNGGTAVLTSTNDVVEINGKVNWDNDPNNTYGISFDAPTTLTKDSNYTLPEDGSNGQFLKTNGSGVLSFDTVTGTTINNNADNRLITGSGTANTLEGESSGTFSSGQLKIFTDGASGSGIRLVGKSGNSGSEIDFYNNADNSNLGYIEFSDAGVRFWNQTNTDITIRTNNTERLRVLAGGGLTFNGDTAAANALDDYEEGTWTPTFGNQSNAQSYSQQSGRYTKIGNFVMVTCQLKLAGDPGSNSSNVTIEGLPYSGKTGGVGGAAHLAYQTDFNSSNGGDGNFTGMINPTESAIRWYKPEGTYYTWALVNNRAEQIRVTAHYFTD